MAAMQQTGDVSKNMTIAQFFAKFGIDVNKDPVTKLAQFTQDQLNKANPMTKMSAIAGGQPPTGPSPSPGGSPSGAPGGSPAPGGGGLASLMQQ
jgi:ABC-type transport system substrate-binding protein